jgi:two-component system CheB/CheR fusion protein
MPATTLFHPAVPPLRIFVVENHPDTLKYLSLYLTQMGHTVLSAWNLEEAVAALPGADCHVVISDIGLPDGFGWELLERAHLEKPIFAIAMSGLGMTADRARSKAAGFRHHLIKPFDPDELDEMLAEAGRELAA